MARRTNKKRPTLSSKDPSWTRAWLILSGIGLLFGSFFLYLQTQVGAVDPKDSTITAVEIESWRIQDIAKELEEKGYIKNALAFFARAQLSGTGGSMTSGTYYLSRDMTTDKLISIIGKGSYAEDATTWVRIQEGSTIEDIAQTLEENDVIYDRDVFLELCRSGNGFVGNEKYPFLQKSQEEGYALEGFLFPDTYEFYYNSTPEQIAEKLLDSFSSQLSDSGIQAKADRLKLSIGDVVKIASVIQKEANADDFTRVSAVLKNRLDDDMLLQCDSTVRYVVNQNDTIMLSDEQMSADTPYNSYLHKGLPPTAICSPSLEALEAAVDPDKEYVKEKYLYFCTTDNANASLIFAKTYSEHIDNIKKYKPNWQIIDSLITGS